MPNVHLKNGEVVNVSLEELREYLVKNRDIILVRHVKRRGPYRNGSILQDN